MAIAAKYKGENRKAIAVIGDGAMTAGMAFEALNHAGVADADMLVILNDNCMSIDPNVGALKDYLTDITLSRSYNKTRNDVWNLIGKIGGKWSQSQLSKFEAALKNILARSSNLFEALNLRYFGPTDGHNVMHLVDLLIDLKKIPGPKLMHVVTTKGKGYYLAEQDQTKCHAPGLFDKVTGQIIKKKVETVQPPKYQDVFGQTIVELARMNDKIMGITPAMPSGSSLNLMMKEMPNRAFDVGIAEQHAVTFSAGMATQGLIPFCNIYSSFMQRAYDQVIHDVALQNLHVIFCLDRGGLVGEDGATHHGAYDLAYMRCIPNMVIAAPMNEEELRNMMYTFQLNHNAFPSSIRYPRGEGVMPDWKKPFTELEIGKGRLIQEGHDIAILSIGHVGNFAREACRYLLTEDIVPAHYDMRFVKPLDTELLHSVCNSYKRIVTVEDGCITGGFGTAVLEFMADNGYSAKVTRLGIPDRFIEHGTPRELQRECGFDSDSIYKTIKSLLLSKQEVTH
jgi:1-deoxy-D-xylulose-5-phosphate synthase